MNRQQLLDLYFLEARSKLIDLAAFLDRIDQAEGEADFRLAAFLRALDTVHAAGGGRAERVLLCLSDSSREPAPVAPGNAACGAWPGETQS